MSVDGYPDDWNNATVVRIGIADEQKLNATKLKNLKQLNYSVSKRKFGTVYDYFVFFLNEKNEVLNINSVCGAGYPLINTTYNIRSAYYYQDDDDSFLKNFMVDTFKADVYDEDIDKLVANLSKYDFLVMEHPLLSGGEFSSNKAKLENYSSRGGLLMISGELASPSTNSMSGVDFRKRAGQSSSERTGVVVTNDDFLSFKVGDSMIFDQYYYVENQTGSSDFKKIAKFNVSDDNAISRWKYGNGTIYFFSDFDVSAFNGNFLGVVEEAAKGMIEGTCNPINLTSISPKNLVKAERYLSYNSKLIRMIIYVWS